MKTLKYIIPITLLIAISHVSCSKEDDDNTPSGNTNTAAITAEEKADLIYMREEEKLARDIYLNAFDIYGLQIFSNISNSEQTHMDRILTLLEIYKIPDPASAEKNVFNNPTLQQLFNDLKAQSEKSLLDALIVGATIEDLDINDLDRCIEGTTKSDILVAYDFLNCGSRNHIQAFTSQIQSNGGSYTVQFISNQKYQEILNTGHENCGQQ